MNALNSVAAAHNLDPAAISAMINTESGWNSFNTTPSGTYSGLTQIGTYDLPNVGFASRSDFLNASPAAQIYGYNNWLNNYGFDQKIANAGIDLSSMNTAQQAALLQGFQFSPNGAASSGLLANIANGQSLNSPFTNTQQAGVLGNTSFNDMSAYYASALDRNPPQYSYGISSTPTDLNGPGFNSPIQNMQAGGSILGTSQDPFTQPNDLGGSYNTYGAVGSPPTSVNTFGGNSPDFGTVAGEQNPQNFTAQSPAPYDFGTNSYSWNSGIAEPNLTQYESQTAGAGEIGSSAYGTNIVGGTPVNLPQYSFSSTTSQPPEIVSSVPATSGEIATTQQPTGVQAAEANPSGSPTFSQYAGAYSGPGWEQTGQQAFLPGSAGIATPNFFTGQSTFSNPSSFLGGDAISNLLSGFGSSSSGASTAEGGKFFKWLGDWGSRAFVIVVGIVFLLAGLFLLHSGPEIMGPIGVAKRVRRSVRSI